MKCKYAAIFFLSLLIAGIFCTHSLASVEWAVQKTLELKNSPVDIAVSQNGAWIFVLTDQGTILVYSSKGTLKGRIEVGTHVDQIKTGPREDILFATSRKNKTVKVIDLEFIWDIDVSGSPTKGPAEAPVTIVVFGDFQ